MASISFVLLSAFYSLLNRDNFNQNHICYIEYDFINFIIGLCNTKSNITNLLVLRAYLLMAIFMLYKYGIIPAISG